MSYDASNIQVLEGLEAVRKRPGMYIGTTGSKGMHHILWEIVDNSIDEAANGYADSIQIEIYKDNSISVRDNGRGIPFDIHPEHKISGVELIFTKLHAGGKFEGNNYNFSGGLHGVGASVTNALSKWLIVDVYKNGEQLTQKFKTVKIGSKVESGIKDGGVEKKLCNKKLVGSKVTFLPDETIFSKELFKFDIINKRLRELAFLNAGVEMIIIDHREELEDGSFKKSSYKYDKGLSDFAVFINRTKTTAYKTPIYFEEKRSDFELYAAIQHFDGYNENIYSYVNNIPTSDGGTHEVGFKTACTRMLNDYARAKGILKDKQENFTGEDLREGMTAVIAIKVKDPQFEGQTKSKLGNPEIKGLVEVIVAEKLQTYLYNCKKDTIDGLFAKAIDAQRVRLATKKAKNLARQKNSLSGNTLVGKLASCSGRDKSINEIYIVEGDSAGGSAKQGRDRSFQAILPLRGKPLNVEKQRIEKILENDEIVSIINSLGAGFDDTFNVDNLKYNKIIILADADYDGAHIRSLLLTFFYRYMKPLITEGHVYIGMPPLYKIEHRNKSIYAYDDEDLKVKLKEVGRGYKLQRYKGLGEMNPQQLWDTTMDPSKRRLTKVVVEDYAETELIIDTLMGNNSAARKEYISNNANFNKEDSFVEISK